MRIFNIKLYHVQDNQYQAVAYITELQQLEESDLQQFEQLLTVPLINLMILPTSSNNEYKIEVDYTGYSQFQNLGANKLSFLVFNWAYLLEWNLRRGDYSFESIKHYIEHDMSRDIINIIVDSTPSLNANIATFENEITTIGNKSLQDLPQMLRMIDTCDYDSVAFDLPMLNSFDLETQHTMYMHHVEKSKDKA